MIQWGKREGKKKEAIIEEDQYVQSYSKLKDSIVKETLQLSQEIFDPNVQAWLCCYRFNF